MFEKNSVLSYYLKLVDMQTLVDSLRGYLDFGFFSWFLTFLVTLHSNIDILISGMCVFVPIWI